MNRAWGLAGLLGLTAAAAGCAGGAGHGFATIETGELSARLEPGERETAGAIRTNLGYELTVESLAIDVDRFELEAQGLSPIVTLPVGSAVSLVPESRLALGTFEPSAELPETTIERASLRLDAWRVVGQVVGSGIEAPVPVTIDLSNSSSLSTDLALVIDRHGPEHIDLGATLTATGTVFDNVEFVDLQGPDGVSIADPESDAGLTLNSALLQAILEVSF